jgi:HlyD family secretion protein
LTWKRISELREAKAVAQQEADDHRLTVAALAAEVEAAKAQVDLIEAPPREDEVHMDQARVEAAKARLELAKVQLERCKLRAPIRGQVLKIDANPGELTGPTAAQPIVVLADTSAYRVRAFVEEYDAPRLRVGMTAKVMADGLPGKEFPGKVVRYSPYMTRKELWSDQPSERYDTKTREVWIDLENAEGLVVGLRVDVAIGADRLATPTQRLAAN